MREDRKREIRIAAEKFRDRCQLRRYGIIDLFSECKKAGFKLIRYPLGDDSILGFVKLQEEDYIHKFKCTFIQRDIYIGP